MSEITRPSATSGLPPLSELLPLGYLYLLVLGIASQSIFYGILGINFLEYSDLLDVLISPISLVTGHLAILAVVLGVSIFSYPYVLVMRRLTARKPSKKDHLILTQPLGRLWLQVTAVALFFAFLGLGVGSGTATRDRIHAGDLRIDHRIAFLDGVTEEVDLIGKNSGYLFFVRPGETILTIAPVADNVRTIQILPPRSDPPTATSP